jgi:hypothetical protein
VIRKKNISVFISLMLLISLEAFGQDVSPRRFELFAARKDGAVQLYWDCRYWSPEMAGFVIMRSEAGKDEWVMLQDAPLLPAIDPVESFSNRGLNEEQQRSLQNDYQQLIMQGDLSEVSPLAMRQILTAQNGPGSGDRIKMKNDFRLALIVGFGFIDNTADEGVSYDYALYAAFTDGTTDNSPLDLFRLGDAPAAIPVVEFTSGREIITLNWELSETEVRMASLLGYLIHRTSPNGGNPEVIANQPVGSFRTTGGITYFRVNDHKADPTEDYLYTLIPVNVFQTHGSPFEALYAAGRYRPLTPPRISMVALFEDEFMELTWEFNPDDVSLLKSFVLELSGDPGKEEGYTIIDTISGTERTYIDRRPKAYGEIYFYHLRALGHYGQDVVSAPEAFYYLGLMTPPPVTGLTSRLVQRDNLSYVHLRWDPRRSRDTVTVGFAVYTDELLPDSFLHLSAIPLIENNEYMFPVSTRGGRPYRFRVAGISLQGRSGIPGETTLEIGTLHLPKVLNINSQRLNPSGLLIQWEYPHFSDLAGFRLLMDGREVAGVDAITGDMRSYLVSEEVLAGTGNPTFRLVAVGSVAVSEPGMAHSLYLKTGNPPRLPAPLSLTFELLESSGKKAVQLCWDPPNGMEEELAGYALFADYATAGRLQRINTVPVLTETHYLYSIPEGTHREGITLGIAVVAPTGETGIVSEIYIPIQHISKEKINNDTP